MAELVVIGLSLLGIFICSMLAVIANHLGEIVKELRDLRMDGIHVHMKQFQLEVGDGILDKIAAKFTKKGKRKAAKKVG